MSFESMFTFYFHFQRTLSRHRLHFSFTVFMFSRYMSTSALCFHKHDTGAKLSITVGRMQYMEQRPRSFLDESVYIYNLFKIWTDFFLAEHFCIFRPLLPVLYILFELAVFALNMLSDGMLLLKSYPLKLHSSCTDVNIVTW